MFRVDYDSAENLLKISVKGFWETGDVPALAAAVGTAAHEARMIRDDFDVLVESLDFPVQANDVADSLSNIMVGGMQTTTGRAAVVVGSQLNKLQAERTLAHPRLRVFLSVDEAREWLGRAG